MKGKTILITGANSGIGFETALALAKMNAQVIIVSSSKEKLDSACRKLKSLSGNEAVCGYTIDLSSQKLIGDGCRLIQNDFREIDVLINNAGCWLSKHTLTEDKIETQFAVNHLAPFLTTHLLLPALNKSGDARIINVNSDAHFFGKINFQDLNLTKNYNGLKAYAQSKLANVLFTYEFERRKLQAAPTINALQPGLVKTDIGLKHTISMHNLIWRIRRLGGISSVKGAATSIYLASSDECKGVSGKYWVKRAAKKSSGNSYDREAAKKLWDISEQLCGITNYFESA